MIKSLFKSFLGLTMALTIVALSAGPAQALYCAFQDPYTGQCVVYGVNNPPAGFVACGSDTNAYSGQILIFTQTNYAGICYRKTVGAGQNSVNNTLGDYDSGIFQIRSIKSNLSRGATVYDGANLSGTPFLLNSYGHNVSNFSAFNASSLVSRN